MREPRGERELMRCWSYVWRENLSVTKCLSPPFIREEKKQQGMKEDETTKRPRSQAAADPLPFSNLILASLIQKPETDLRPLWKYYPPRNLLALNFSINSTKAQLQLVKFKESCCCTAEGQARSSSTSFRRVSLQLYLFWKVSRCIKRWQCSIHSINWDETMWRTSVLIRTSPSLPLSALEACRIGIYFLPSPMHSLRSLYVIHVDLLDSWWKDLQAEGHHGKIITRKTWPLWDSSTTSARLRYRDLEKKEKSHCSRKRSDLRYEIFRKKSRVTRKVETKPAEKRRPTHSRPRDASQVWTLKPNKNRVSNLVSSRRIFRSQDLASSDRKEKKRRKIELSIWHCSWYHYDFGWGWKRWKADKGETKEK